MKLSKQHHQSLPKLSSASLYMSLVCSLSLIACGGENALDSHFNHSEAQSTSTTDLARTEALAVNETATEMADLEAATQLANASTSEQDVLETAGVVNAKGLSADILQVSMNALGSTNTAAIDNFVPVFRYMYKPAGLYVYTSAAATISKLNKDTNYRADGIVYYASTTANINSSTVLVPVQKYTYISSGAQFYTANATDIANLKKPSALQVWKNNGIAWYASTFARDNYSPVYRFKKIGVANYFFTSNTTEYQAVLKNKNWSYQGVAYYAPKTDLDSLNVTPTPTPTPTPTLTVIPVNDTGWAGIACFQTGTVKLMDCAGQAAISTGMMQDGMIGRDKTVNNSVDGRLGFSYSKISPTGAVLASTAVLGSGANNWACTKDNVTGLIWEVKTSDGGLQDQNKGYTYFTDTTSIQKYSTGGPASLAELNSENNAPVYVKAINSKKLCGLSNWRLPKEDELFGLIDLSVTTPNPAIDLNWFPNTPVDKKYIVDSTLFVTVPHFTYAVNFMQGDMLNYAREKPGYIRLVSGNVANLTQRYTYLNNGSEVLDNRTGLTWMRCALGQTWSGSSCTGNANTYSHPSALSLVASQTGWRIPNVKELQSISDRTTLLSGVTIHPNAFPATPSGNFWSSTPLATISTQPILRAWYVNFNTGNSLSSGFRDTDKLYVRLVK